MATSNGATLKPFILAEQCHTQNFYLRRFKSDFDAVKSKITGMPALINTTDKRDNTFSWLTATAYIHTHYHTILIPE